MNYIKDIPYTRDNNIIGIVEIEKGSRDKKELIEGSFSALETVRKIKLKYPFYYGCIPQTLAGDKDAIDVVIITKSKLKELDIVELDIIGIIKTVDNGEQDDKVFAVPYGEVFSDKHLLKEIKKAIKFLTKYKGKYQKFTITDKTLYDYDIAMIQIKKAHKTFNRRIIKTTNVREG